MDKLLPTAATSRPAPVERGRGWPLFTLKSKARCSTPQGPTMPSPAPSFACLETISMDSDGEPPWHVRLAREMNANREELREFLVRNGVAPIDTEEFHC